MIVFTDIDGCLIDGESHLSDIERFTSNVSEVRTAILDNENKGLRFGLNSSRGCGELAAIASILNVSCSVIGEYGSFIGEYDANSNQLKILEALAPEVVLPDFLVGTTHQMMKAGISDGLYFEQERQFSAGVYCISNGKRHALQAAAVGEVLAELNPNHWVFISENHTLWCLPDKVTKGTGIEHYKKTKGGEIGMIGHDLSDMPALLRSDVSMAPANATFKGLVDYRSRFDYTEGVIDCLKWINEYWS